MLYTYMRSIQSLLISQDDMEEVWKILSFVGNGKRNNMRKGRKWSNHIWQWKEERNEKREKIRKSHMMIVCYRWEHALDTGAHLNINAYCFFKVDSLVFLRLFLVFFRGARDGCCSINFRGAGNGFTGISFGGARFGWLWGDCSSGMHSLFGCEAVKFILSRYGDWVDVFGVGRWAPVYRQFRDPQIPQNLNTVCVQSVILFWISICSCAIKYNGTYLFKVFVPFVSCTRDVPSVEHDEEEQECPFTKLDGIVPAWNQFSVGINDVVLHKFIMFEVEFVIGEKFRAVVATKFDFLCCRKVSIYILVCIRTWLTILVLNLLFLFNSGFVFFRTDSLLL